MRKLLIVLLTFLFTLCGCAQTSASPAASTTSTIPDSNINPFEDQLTEDDYVIPDVALAWQERNAPLFLREDFFDPYTYGDGEDTYTDFSAAMASIEIDASYDHENNIITITPERELGPIMFQFTLYCIPVEELGVYVCCEYLYEFMHTNSNNDEWVYSFSESEPPNDNTEFYIVLVDGVEVWLTDNVFYEVDSTIATMMLIGNEEPTFVNDATITTL
ncbi:hypothetical protein J6X15_02335 [Candidatus Saccharibacteria bacterium]|nr:hypothetical protein [Candidatus Saccharibacteria bacterium]